MPKLWRKIEIQDGGRSPSWIFENLISEHWVHLGCRFSISVPNLVQKCLSTPTLWPKVEIQDGGRPPSWNVISPYRTTHEVYSLGYISLSNFVLIRYIVLKIWGFDFLQNWLEMPIYAPNISVFWGIWTPKNNCSSSRPPKDTSALETTYYER